jgi:DNA-directed RNA polymerase subunit M/transcription elongation factor TFIIS
MSLDSSIRGEVARLGLDPDATDRITTRLCAHVHLQEKRALTHAPRPALAIFRWRKKFSPRPPTAMTPPKRRALVAAFLIMQRLRRIDAATDSRDEGRLLSDLLQEDLPHAWTRSGSADIAATETLTGQGTGFFRCSRCRLNHTTYYEQQTSGADEAMTVFICCQNCGKTWKI